MKTKIFAIGRIAGIWREIVCKPGRFFVLTFSEMKNISLQISLQIPTIDQIAGNLHKKHTHYESILGLTFSSKNLSIGPIAGNLDEIVSEKISQCPILWLKKSVSTKFFCTTTYLVPSKLFAPQFHPNFQPSARWLEFCLNTKPVPSKFFAQPYHLNFQLSARWLELAWTQNRSRANFLHDLLI